MTHPGGEMTASARVSARRRRCSNGNAMIEWMLVLLPYMAILTFFFDVTFAIYSWSTIQNAVREGCRYAITFQTSGQLGQDASIKQVVAQYSMALVASNSSLINVNYFAPSAPNVAIAPGATPAGNVPGNIVEVSIQSYPIQWLFPLSGTIINPYRSTTPSAISVYSSDILGGFPAGTSSVAR
jgi:Flp pilus assembly protein TadG